MRFTIEDLNIIIDALDDTLIVQQLHHSYTEASMRGKRSKRRIDKTTRTKAKLLLMLKETIEE